MNIENGKTYICKNGYIVTLVKNSLPYYKFSALSKSAKDDQGFVVDCSEVWREDGVAYHDDCGYNIAREYSYQIEG